MTITATLIEQGRNRLRYLLVCDSTGGTTLNITTTGGATPDLKTNSLQGPVKECALAATNGLGKVAAGALTQAQARAIWMSDRADSTLGNSKVPRCLPRLSPRLGNLATWTVDANVSAGNPIVVVTCASTGEAYLDIQSQGAIGL